MSPWRCQVVANDRQRAVLAVALELHAAFERGCYAAAGAVGFAPSDPCNSQDRVRRMTSRLVADGPRAFLPRADKVAALQALQNRVRESEICLDDEDLVLMATACEMLMRLHTGQWHIALEALAWCDRAARQSIMDELRHYARASVGLTDRAISEDARIAGDLHQVLRRAAAYRRRPEGGRTVEFDTPLRTSYETLAQVVPMGIGMESPNS